MYNLNEGYASNACDLIASLFSHPVFVALSQAEGLIDQLYKEERALIEHAIKKRQNDFAVGRLCAKKALSALGIENFPVLMNPKGAPIWPAGVSGSISHAKGCCAAVVAQIQDGESLGLDIEEISRIKESIWEYAFCPEEIVWLRTQSTESPKWASVIFAAKEAFYKAQYPITHSWFGFKDAVILIDKESYEFTVRLLTELGEWSKAKSFKGKYAFFNEHVAAGIWINKHNL
jgi:4'-phosphopantetheinyl transferase EntD